MPLAILSFTPQSGPVRTQVTLNIMGIAANDPHPQVTITFNNTPGHIERINETQFLAEVPENATTGLIAVRYHPGDRAEAAETPVPFEVTQGEAKPRIDYLPTTAHIGSLVRLRGQNLGKVSGVFLGPAPMVPVPGFTHVSNLVLQFKIPLTVAPGPYKVILQAPGAEITSNLVIGVVKAASA